MSNEIVDQLVAEFEIRQQLSTYCRGLDRFDVELWKSFWHDDATLDYRGVGLRAIAWEHAEEMTLGHAQWAAHSHQITGSLIKVVGRRAVSETLSWNILRGYPDAAGVVTNNHYQGGRYLDYWSKRDGRWAIDHRYAPGGGLWLQTPLASRLGKLSRRGRDDPSYELFASLEHESEDVEEILAADREIRRQLCNYCRAVDRVDVELWKSVWHPDGTLDYPDSQETGIQGVARDVAELMTRGHEAWASHSHHLTNFLLKVSGDLAVTETGASAILRGYPDSDGRVIDDHYRGRYLDRWSKRDGRWAIDHRLMVEDFTWRQIAGEPLSGGRARRDRQDPGYELVA